MRAEYPNQLDYSGDVPLFVFDKSRHLPSLPLSIEYMPPMLIAFVHGSAAVLLVPDLNWKQLCGTCVQGGHMAGGREPNPFSGIVSCTSISLLTLLIANTRTD